MKMWLAGQAIQTSQKPSMGSGLVYQVPAGSVKLVVLSAAGAKYAIAPLDTERTT
ncbi:MAG: hypothetical protein U0452_10865 [Anaerolineae bacterium]